MKKKLLVIILILMLVIAGVLAYLYFYTDVFKTDQQIFWTYVTKNSEVTNLFNSEDIKNVKQKKITNSYQQNSNLTVKQGTDEYVLNTNTNANNSNDILTTVNLEKNSNNIANFNVVKKSNLVGFRMDDLANGYIVVKNSNLKDLAKNMGIENTDLIPENINFESYLEILEFSEEDINYITDKYSKIIIADTNKSNYKKGEAIGIKIDNEFYTGKAHTLTLTEKETQKILKDVFEEMASDSRLLNLISTKMKLLNLGEEYTSVNSLSERFRELSKKMETINAQDEQFVEITVYIANSKLLQTNIKYRDENLIKITYNKENNKLNIKQESPNKSNMFVLSISDLLDKVISQMKEINIETSSNDTETETRANILCNNKVEILYTAKTKITEDIEKTSDYEDSTKLILNNLNKEQLSDFKSAISEEGKNVLHKILNSIKEKNSQENDESSEAEVTREQE